MGPPPVPHTPSEQSLSFRRASNSTRNAVLIRDDRKCWLCEAVSATMLEVAHNISASIPLSRLECWKSLGLLPRQFYPTQAKNLVLLCSNCHLTYDCDYPEWVLLPQNLDLFIDFEKRDYDARVAAARRGVQQGRAMPQIGDTGVTCQPYVLDPSFLRSSITEWNSFPRQFLGLPQTLILKATAACFCPVKRFPAHDKWGNVVQTGIPPPVAEKVLQLSVLWTRDDPPVVAGPRGQKRRREPQDDDGVDKKDDSEDPGGKDFKSLNSRSLRSGSNTSRGCSSRATKRVSGRSRDLGVSKENQFVWGPEMRATDIMSIADGWRRAWEMDKAARKARSAVQHMGEYRRRTASG